MKQDTGVLRHRCDVNNALDEDVLAVSDDCDEQCNPTLYDFNSTPQLAHLLIPRPGSVFPRTPAPFWC